MIPIYYHKNMCQHGQKITKFCITEYCHHKESAGCDYCIRKYHFHLTNTQILTEPDLDNLIKNLTLPTDIKHRSRSLQQGAIDYLRNLKLSFNTWIDQAQNSIADRLGYPTLRKQGLLNTYTRIKHKEYRKINAKELRAISQFSKSVTPEFLKKEQLANYYKQVEWTASILQAIEKVAAQISKLPEVKEGDGQIQAISKSKLNQIYESIRQEKDKRDLQSKTSGIQAINIQGLRLDDNSLLKRRQSAEKTQNNNSPASQIKAILEKKNAEKLPKEPEKPKFLASRQNSAKQSTTNKESTQDKKRESTQDKKRENTQDKKRENTQDKNRENKTRKSSIEQKFDLRFGNINEDKSKQEKQKEQIKKRLIERFGQQKQRQQSQENTEAKKQIGRQASIKVKEDESITGNLTNLKLGSKRQESFKQQSLLYQTSKETAQFQKSQLYDLEKQQQEGLQNSASDSNFLGIKELLINNILPPLLLPIKSSPKETITQKIVKIPLTAMNQVSEQIESPIFKSKKRQQDKDKQGEGVFGILLMAASDKSAEKANESLVKPMAERKTVEQSALAATIKAPQKQNLKPIAKQLQKIQQKQDDLIVLEINQKNSLLLFSQALKSPGDRAIELLKASLKYSSDNLSAAQYLSYLYLQGGKAKECAEVCQSILVRIEDTPEQFELTLHLHNNKAAALNQLGRYSESIMILEKCLRFRRKHYFYKNLGDAYFCLGIPEKAAMNYDKAIKLDPHSDEALYNLAVSQFIQEQYTSAQLNINQAKKIEPLNQTYTQLSQQIEKRLANLAI